MAHRTKNDDRSLSGPVLAKKMRKNKLLAPHAKKVANRKRVTQRWLDQNLPDYISGGDIRKLFN